jgi:hypothetical protein
MNTDFDIQTHGFHFRNTFSGGAVVAELARQNRLSDLIGTRVPRIIRAFARVSENATFWGTLGLCGGMSWAALDRYNAGAATPASHSPPAPDEPLFSELVARQADSMKGRALLEQCLRLQVTPDLRPWWWFWAEGVAQRTLNKEWPTLRNSLDQGVPTALTLIRASQLETPARHHQVVAIGYETSGPEEILVSLYDPNHPGISKTLRLSGSGPNVSIEAEPTTGNGLRGFINWTPVPN